MSKLKKYQPQLAHIYTARCWKDKVTIKLLCTGDWVEAEEETPEIPHRRDGYLINGVHQCSVGGGHNATCPYCLVEYAGRKMKTDNKLTWKIIELARGHINGKHNPE